MMFQLAGDGRHQSSNLFHCDIRPGQTVPLSNSESATQTGFTK